MPIATPRSVIIAEAVKGLVQRVNLLAQVDKALSEGVKLSDGVTITASDLRAAFPAEDVSKIEAVLAAYFTQFPKPVVE